MISLLTFTIKVLPPIVFDWSIVYSFLHLPYIDNILKSKLTEANNGMSVFMFVDSETLLNLKTTTHMFPAVHAVNFFFERCSLKKSTTESVIRISKVLVHVFTD